MHALAFWGAAVATWALALPLAATLMRRLPDAGAGVALPLGLIIAGISYFLLRVASVVPAGDAGWLSGLLVLGVVSGLVLRNDRRCWPSLKRSLPGILISLGLFTALFFAFVWFRSYVGAIADTEQPMDFLYLNATLVSPDYAPHDPWFAGEQASYYYFGYLQMALLTAVSGIPASFGYNMALACTFAAAGTGVASLVFALVRWTAGRRVPFLASGAAIAAVLLLLAVGSLSAPFEWAAAHDHTNDRLFRTFGVQWMIPCTTEQVEAGITDCYSGAVNPRTTEWYPTEYWFWWRGTRIIPDTITEFPFFSFLLGDLHPHVMAIPSVLVAIGLAMVTWRGRGSLSWRSHRLPWRGLAYGVVFGSLAFTNAWDAITFCALLAAAVFARNVRAGPAGRAILDAASWLAPVFAVAVITYLPWYVTFSSQADGLYPYIGKGTIPAHAFLQFGVPLALAICAAPFAFRRLRPGPMTDALAGGLWAPLLPLLAWLVFVAARGELTEAVESRTGLAWLTLGAYAILCWLLAAAFWSQLRKQPGLALVAGLGAMGALLLYGTELFFIGDVFKGFIPRQNTVFKLSYQAWIVLAVAGPAAVALAIASIRRGNAAGWMAFPALLLLAAGLVYPLISLPNRTNGFDMERDIDGLGFLARSQPEEYALVRWVGSHVAPGDVIIEATGRQYRTSEDGPPTFDPNGPRIDYGEPGRVSARTGRQTPIGWPSHEIQWRGTDPSVGEEIGRRQEMVDRVYLGSPSEALGLLDQLGARYVVVGRIERERYPVDLDARFGSYLDVVFEDGNTRVYAVPVFRPMQTS